MKWKASLAAALLCFGAQALSYGAISGPQRVNLWKLNHARRSAQNSRLSVQNPLSQVHSDSADKDKDKGKNPGGFVAQLFQQPLDHFDPKSQDVFNQRYWVNTRHYQPRKGAPVIVLDCGESNAEVCP